MRLEEDLFFEEDDKSISIAGKPASALITNLRKQGINVDSKYSEQRVEYSRNKSSVDSSRKSVIVPLGTRFTPKAEASTTAYFLRDGEGVELKLESSESLPNYENNTRSGIRGKLTLETIDTPVDISIIDKVKIAIRQTYGFRNKKGD